jgi:hypothetical protein
MVSARSAFQLFSSASRRAAGQWIKQMVSARSAFQFSAFQLFSISAFQDPPRLPSPKKTGQKNILIIIHFPLANFVSAGVIYPHRKKVGFGPGGLNPRKQ